MHRRLIIAIFAGCLLAACGGGVDRTTAGAPAPKLSAETPIKLRILVIGGTSGIGLETVKFALARGHNVTAMARRPERMSLQHERLATIGGDILDAESVAAAMAGQDAVVNTIGIGPTRKPVSLFSEGTRTVLETMPKVGIRRVLTVTGIGAGDSRGHGGFFYDWILQPLALKTIYEDKDIAEALLSASDTDWTIVRPGHLIDDASTNQYRIIDDMEGITSGKIARADVAHFIVAALESRGYIGATVFLTN